MHPMLNMAVKAARNAGNIIMRHHDRLERLTVENKGKKDYVSEVDRMAENEIIRHLRAAYPNHGILAEETGNQPGDDYVWIIDPLDGTTNFLHGFPHFSVSIALRHKDRLEQAVIFDPPRNELFTATRGSGAHLNDRRIRVSRVTDLEYALLGAGFPFRSHRHMDAWIKTLREFMLATSGIRRPGSAALDLAHVACGRFDGFWEIGLNPWDMAAGALIIQEAGGMVTDFSGDQNYLENGNIVAGNPKIHAEMLRRIQPHLTPELQNQAR
ncbi:MAG TPA: inositol monophosphatase family protein [Sulfuricaulis sp.]|nr:inositol monophosphatase family protein [Sulfuricaulis sp.]